MPESYLAHVWEELATVHERNAQAAEQLQQSMHVARNKAIAETLRKCARELRQAQADRSRGIQYGHGNTQFNAL